MGIKSAAQRLFHLRVAHQLAQQASAGATSSSPPPPATSIVTPGTVESPTTPLVTLYPPTDPRDHVPVRQSHHAVVKFPHHAWIQDRLNELLRIRRPAIHPSGANACRVVVPDDAEISLLVAPAGRSSALAFAKCVGDDFFPDSDSSTNRAVENFVYARWLGDLGLSGASRTGASASPDKYVGVPWIADPRAELSAPHPTPVRTLLLRELHGIPHLADIRIHNGPGVPPESIEQVVRDFAVEVISPMYAPRPKDLAHLFPQQPPEVEVVGFGRSPRDDGIDLVFVVHRTAAEIAATLAEDGTAPFAYEPVIHVPLHKRDSGDAGSSGMTQWTWPSFTTAMKEAPALHILAWGKTIGPWPLKPS